MQVKDSKAERGRKERYSLGHFAEIGEPSTFITRPIMGDTKEYILANFIAIIATAIRQVNYVAKISLGLFYHCYAQ